MEVKHKYNLTERQKELFDYVKAYDKATGVMPYQSELATKFEISQATIAKHLMAIERRGWIKRAKGLKGGMTILK